MQADYSLKSKIELLDRFGFPALTEPVSISVKPIDFSDAGNVEVFERIFGSSAIWTRGAGWFVWNGRFWESNDTRAMSLALELSSRMLDEALTEFTSASKLAIAADAGEFESKKLTAAKMYLTHANATRRKSRIEAILGLAQAGLWRELSVFDANPRELNTPAGIVDLASGVIRPHNPAALCSKITKAAPGGDGKQMWQELLKTVTDGDFELAGFLQQVAGMALLGKVYHEGIIIAYGGGRNGKSTFFNAIVDILGGYAGHIAVNTLTTERANKGAALATLRGRRFVLTGELEEHQRLSVAMLKALASTDTLVAEEKFKSPEEFKQSHTLCLFTNHLPRVGSTDGGTWRRLTVVPFIAVISEKNAIQNYADVLAEQAGPAILHWAIEGSVNFIKNGYRLIIPDSVARATMAYQARENWISNFIAECCISGARVSGGELYAAYRTWAASTGEYARRQCDFVAAMEGAGYKKFTSNGRAYWLGIGLEAGQIQGTWPPQ